MRFLKFHLTDQRGDKLQYPHTWLVSRLLLQTAPDGTATTDKRRKVYARGITVKSR